MSEYVVCPRCDGVGFFADVPVRDPGADGIPCPVCHGTGEVDLAHIRLEWKRTVTRGGCVMCRAFFEPFDPSTRPDRARIEGHHILPKEDLKREGYGDRLWDARNGLGLCALHHARHERWVQRVPRGLIPVEAEDFAAELELGWLLDREYPEEIPVA